MTKSYKILARKPLTKCPSPTSLWGRDILSVILTKKVRTYGILLAFTATGFYPPTKVKQNLKK